MGNCDLQDAGGIEAELEKTIIGIVSQRKFQYGTNGLGGKKCLLYSRSSLRGEACPH